LDSKISFLENTGFMGNCKAFGNGMFEFSIRQLNDYKIYCVIDNDTNIIVFACNLNELLEVKNKESEAEDKKKENSKELGLWKDIKLESLKDEKHAKAYFNQIMSIYHETSASNEVDSFLMNELKNIFKGQGKDNFKNLAGFDLSDLDISKSITTIKNLQERLKLTVKIKSVNYIAKKSGVSEKSIQSILKIKDDFDLKDVNVLRTFFTKSII
jgi:putative component of toxin-antitoxin plasmid stabilization module